MTEKAWKLADLAGMSPAEYAGYRDGIAERLNIGKKFLDAEYAQRRKGSAQGSDDDPAHWSVEPAEHSVIGGDLLKKVSRRIKRHVVMEDNQALTIAIWIAFAWTHDAATHSPILCVTSPEAECGKTTLMGLLQFLTPKGMLFVDTSAAVLYRMVEKWHPTLIVDEADVMFKDNPELRSVINAGWTRGSAVPRCNPETNEPEFFQTFGPKVIGLKGLRLPDTTLSRSIIIAMERKLPSDRVADFNHLDDAELASLRSELARFAQDNIEQLRGARPQPPEGFYNRLAANWCLMLAIADHCGLGPEARAAAAKISRRADEASLGVELLRDIRDTFDRLRLDRLPSQQLVNELANMLDRPWCEISNGGKPITQRGLAGLLKDYGVRPKTINLLGPEQLKAKGYLLEWFEKAFRYIPAPEPPQNIRNSVTTAENSQKFRNLAEDEVTEKMAGNGQSYGVTDDFPPSGSETHIDPFERLKDASLALKPKADDWPELPPELDRRRHRDGDA